MDQSWVKIKKAYAGKDGVYSGSGRRTNNAYLTWIIFIFKIALKIKTQVKSKYLSMGFVDTNYGRGPSFEIHIDLNVRGLINKFLRALPILKLYISGISDAKIGVHISHNWRNCNMKIKKSRYIKKFKRSLLLKKDMHDRKKYL